jgi:hypothetical protein
MAAAHVTVMVVDTANRAIAAAAHTPGRHCM